MTARAQGDLIGKMTTPSDISANANRLMLGTSTSRMSCPDASRTGRCVHSWSRWPSVAVRPVG